MKTISTNKLGNDLPRAVDQIVLDGERITIQRDGKNVAALVSMHDLAVLQEIEDRRDLAEAEESLAEPGASTSWEDVRRRLDL